MSLDESIGAIIRTVVREELRAFRAELLPALLTPAQAAALAQCSVKTVLRWLREEKLQRRGTERRPLVDRQELQALLSAPAPSRSARAERPSAETEVRRLLGAPRRLRSAG